jgi:hypothetical protein
MSTIAVFLALGGTAYAVATIDSADIVNNSVQSVDLQNGGVLNADIRDSSINTAKIADGSVRAADLGNGSVGPLKIQNNAVNTVHIAPDTVEAADIAPDGVRSSEVDDASLLIRDMGYTGSQSVDLASIPAQSCTNLNFVPSGGPSSAGTYLWQIYPSLNAGNIVVTPRANINFPTIVSSITFVACNPTAAAIDPPEGSWRWAIFQA